jgi:hypothetical protein
MVTVDRTAPAVLEITQEDSELIIPITEPVLPPQVDNYSFTSSNSSCQVNPVAARSDQLWFATLIGCEGSSFSFTIVANSVVDLAGNTGPSEGISFAVEVPLPEVEPTPEPTTSPEVEVPPTPEPTNSPEVEVAPTPEPTPEPELSSAADPIKAPEPEAAAKAPVVAIEPTSQNPEVGLAEEVLAPEALLEALPTQDSELAQAPTQRRQAAQSVITASTTAEPVNSSLGWTVGLAIAGVLLLAAGLSLRHRGISDLLVG